MNKLIYASAASIAIGAAFGWAARGPHGSGAPDAGVVAIAQPASSQTLLRAPGGIDLAQLHAAIREELAATSASQNGGKQASTSPAAAQTPASVEVVAQRRAALQEIQGMVASGHWGDTERSSFQQKIATLDPQQAEQALQEVLIGLNSGNIQTEVNSPL